MNNTQRIFPVLCLVLCSMYAHAQDSGKYLYHHYPSEYGLSALGLANNQMLTGGNLQSGNGQPSPWIQQLDKTGDVLWAVAYTSDVHGARITALKPFPDGGYLLLTENLPVSSPTNSQSGWTRIKPDGTVQWAQTGPSGCILEYATRVTDGFVLSGKQKTSGGNFQGVAIKINDNGAIQWFLKIPFGLNCTLKSGILASNGFIYLVGEGLVNGGKTGGI